MYSAVWFFPLLALITIILLLLALFLLISSPTSQKRRKKEQMPSYMGRLPQAQWYKQGMSEGRHDLSPHTQHLCQKLGGAKDSLLVWGARDFMRGLKIVCQTVRIGVMILGSSCIPEPWKQATHNFSGLISHAERREKSSGDDSQHCLMCSEPKGRHQVIVLLEMK